MRIRGQQRSFFCDDNRAECRTEPVSSKPLGIAISEEKGMVPENSAW